MNQKTIITGMLSLIGLTSIFAQPTLVEKVEAKEGKVVIPYEKWKLPNGLTILLHEDHSDPVVHTLVTYKVGSNRESIGKSGFAHFFEHMMFQGSKHVADEEGFKIINAAGGDGNGNTTEDRTVYLETMPSNNLEMSLWLEADRMGFLLDSLTQKKFDTQREAVKNEKSQNVENQPYALAMEEDLMRTLYPDGHPYSWPVIGYVDDLNRVTVEDAKNFFLRWYGPNNAILTLAGDFNSAEALKLIEKYFGSLKPCPDVKKMKVAPVTLASDKYVATKDRIYYPMNMRIFPTVPQYHRDEAALDILATMMGSGKSSIFYKTFVKAKPEIAADAAVFHKTKELAGEFTMYLLAYPPEDFNLEKMFTDIDAKVKATIEEFGNTGITDDAILRAKSQFESQAYRSMETVDDKAGMISEWERLLGKTYTVSDEIERYTKVTKEDLLRVFNKYIKGTGAAVLNIYPILNQKDSVKSVNPFAGQNFPMSSEYNGLSYKPNADNFDRSKKPTPGAPKSVSVPDYFSTKLSNGIPVLGTKNTETPEVTILINIDGGNLVLNNDELKKLGVADLTAEMLNQGTKNYTNEQISVELEKLGSSINFGSSTEESSISVRTLKKNLDATLKLLEEKLLNPGFNAEDFKLAKKQYKASIKNQETDANAIADKAFAYALYGNTVLGLEPSVKTVDNITLEDVKSYYNRFYSPTVARVVVVGDLEEKEIISKLDFLNKWQAKDVKIQPIPEPVTTTEPQFFVMNKTAAPSTVIRMGYPSVKYDATGEYYKNRVANFVFGGGHINSRLNLNLREDKGYTYGIYSGFYGTKNVGVFQISSSIKRFTTGLALAEVIKEFKNYQENGVTDKDLEFTKNSLLNAEALKYEGSYAKAGFLSNIARYNLDKNYTAKQNEVLKNMTKADLNAQIKKSFDLNKLTTVVVGDKAYIEANIEKAAKDSKNKEVLNKVKLKKLSID